MAAMEKGLVVLKTACCRENPGVEALAMLCDVTSNAAL